MKTYKGIFIPNHKVIDRASKAKAEDKLYNWKPGEFTAEEWIQKLDLGQTIQPSEFQPKRDGTFTHAMMELIEDTAIKNKKLWQNTFFICADGDNLKGIEFLKDGSDKNPNGLEPWTEPGKLSEKFPELLHKVYAVGESVSSMLKEPLHRRFRIIFLFDKPFTDEAHYRSTFLQLANEFPIISMVDRAPSQPVFGNGRKDFNFHIQGNILNLDDYPLVEKQQTPQSQTYTNRELLPNETLEEYLRRHNIPYEQSKNGKLYVECPYSAGHTDGKQGKTDSYVFDDGKGWAFYCSHESCKRKGHNTWDSFKTGHGIRNTFNKVESHFASESSEAEGPPDHEVEQSDEDPMNVKFPEEMFYGIFDTYRRSLDGRTPVPDAFAFASLKHIISASLGRRIHVESQKPIFPNVFTGLIGESSTAHKGISLYVAKQLLKKADPNVFFLPRTTTDEGFIDMFNIPELHSGSNDDEDNNEYYSGGISPLVKHEQLDNMVNAVDSHESIRIMAAFEELSAILNQSKKVTFSGMTERFMELYDTPDEIIVGNKGEKARADFPTFTMIGASAFELIEQSLEQHFITAGFTNRIEWYIGQEKPPIFIYKSADPEMWTECVNQVQKIRDSYLVGQSFTITDDAYLLGDKWNKEFTEHLQEIQNILVQGSIKRMKIFVIKNALIFAALEHRGDFQITEDDMLRAIQLSQYNCTVVEKLFGNFANTEHQRVCNRIVEILKSTPMKSAKQVQNRMRWAQIKEVKLALDLMAEMQIIEIVRPKRTPLYYVKKDEIE